MIADLVEQLVRGAAKQLLLGMTERGLPAEVFWDAYDVYYGPAEGA